MPPERPVRLTFPSYDIGAAGIMAGDLQVGHVLGEYWCWRAWLWPVADEFITGPSGEQVTGKGWLMSGAVRERFELKGRGGQRRQRRDERATASPPVFGRRLRGERESQSFSLRQLGARSGVNATTELRAEQGHDLSLGVAVALARALCLPLAALLTELECGRCGGRLRGVDAPGCGRWSGRACRVPGRGKRGQRGDEGTWLSRTTTFWPSSCACLLPTRLTMTAAAATSIRRSSRQTASPCGPRQRST